MRTLKIIFFFVLILFLSIPSYSAIDNNSPKYSDEQLELWTHKLPPIVKQLPQKYHKHFAAMFTDIETFIHENPTPRQEDDVRYMISINEILDEYSQNKLPFMLRTYSYMIQMDKILVLKMEVICDPKMTKGFTSLTFYWNITLIKQKDI